MLLTFRWNDFPGLEWASASGRIPEGPISSAWRRAGKRIVWRIEVPAGAEAKAVIPAPAGEIRENGRPLADKAEAGRIRTISPAAQPDIQELTIGPGTYEFSFPAPAVKTTMQSN